MIQPILPSTHVSTFCDSHSDKKSFLTSYWTTTATKKGMYMTNYEIVIYVINKTLLLMNGRGYNGKHKDGN